MDARNFFFVCAGILCLVAAYHLGATRAEADWQNSGRIVGINAHRLWDSSGAAWIRNGTSGWSYDEAQQLPAASPVTAVKFCVWDSGANEPVFVTYDDEVWVHNGSAWIQMPPLPSGPVSLRDESFGRTKALHR